jgi:hypothetical protein
LTFKSGFTKKKPGLMKKDYLPMALGFWGVALPLLVFGVLFSRTAAERVAVFLSAGIFILIGYLIRKAKD